nr:MAG TPA: hypothetical protein [Microviridae sp.]
MQYLVWTKKIIFSFFFRHCIFKACACDLLQGF